MRTGLFLLLGCTAAAQGEAPPPARTLVDAVVATVNDSAIMWSTVQTAASGEISAETERLGPLPPARRDQIQRQHLEREIRRHRMAQAAKTFGPLSPEQVEQLLQEQFDRDRQEQMRDLGSLHEFSRQLQRTGRTWPTHMREQRIEKLFDFAEELSVGRRLQRQTNLFVTPRMMRETYSRLLDWFVHDAEAKIVQVSFLGPDAARNAEAAAEVWRKEAIDARELAKRFPQALPIGVEVDVASLSAEFEALRRFALAGPLDAVSAPIPVGTAVNIAKITHFRAARNGRFQDPDVQAELREFCARRVVAEFREQAYARAEERTQVQRTRMVDSGR
jgi:hypothetical protein